MIFCVAFLFLGVGAGGSVALGRLGHAEPAAKGAHHVAHGLLLGLFHHLLLLLEPLLAVLANVLRHELVVALTALARNVLEHLALGKGLAGALLTLGLHHAHVARLEAEHVAEGTHAGDLGLALGLVTLLELAAHDGLAARKLLGDVLALKGLDDAADVVVFHGMDVLEEGNHVDEAAVTGVAVPRRKNDGIVGLLAYKLRIRVDDDDLGEVTVKVGKILYYVLAYCGLE